MARPRPILPSSTFTGSRRRASPGFDVLAGPDVIAVPVPWTDHDVARDFCLANGHSGVLAQCCRGRRSILEVEQRHLHVLHRDDLGRAGRDVFEVAT